MMNMIKAGAFGPDRTFVSFEPDPRFAGQDQFASTIVYGTVTVRDRENRDRRHDLIVKTKHHSAALREVYKTDDQFHNEILFYERLMPFLLDFVRSGRGGPVEDRVPRLCRYFYGRNDCGDLTARDVIVLENATPHGYKLSDDRLFLDFDHLILALRTLAK